LAPGVVAKTAIADLRRSLRAKVRESGFDITRPERPTDLVNFGRVQNFPLILAGILGALAAAVLAHALISVIRRRRRDLAILKTLGFLRSQVRRTVAWQATTLVGIALALGLPIGIALGRVLWTTFANALGVVPAARVPMPIVLLAIPAGLLLANVIAARPARNAARTSPAVALRTE
jgi:predicted lysophospholipase L1 biosynthesis ABC-type transport system permease subunit